MLYRKEYTGFDMWWRILTMEVQEIPYKYLGGGG
jgi:hypothetical protein